MTTLKSVLLQKGIINNMDARSPGKNSPKLGKQSTYLNDVGPRKIDKKNTFLPMDAI